jgi:HlyD family secretion protein
MPRSQQKPRGHPKAKHPQRGEGGEAGGEDLGALEGAPAAAGQGAQFRERLVSELKLDADQQARLDPILADMRNKFMALREMPEEARARMGAAIRAESRARIEDILRPEQKARYAEIVAEQAGRTGAAASGRVWVLEDGKPKALNARLGLTDGTATEISGEGIAEGLDVLSGTQGTQASGSGSPAKGGPPRMFF